MDKVKDLADIFKRVFDSKDGKKVLGYLENTYHIHASTMRSTDESPVFAEGQRTVVLDIKDLINYENGVK